MPGPFNEISNISYGKNITNSFVGVIIGLILFVLSFIVLWKNEGHSVEQIAKANYINKTAIEISADTIDRANDNKLVQLAGNATTDTTLTDGIITLQNVFALSRKVEMYQWEEDVETKTENEIGGNTTETKTYSYEKVWSEDAIDSKNFKKPYYTNPAFPLKSADFYAKSGKLGEFNITEKQTKSMNDYLEYENLPQIAGYKICQNMYYKGYDPESPNIGDIRISYEYIPSGTGVSIIGLQRADNTLTAYTYKDSSIYLQQSGLKTKGEMITTFKKNNKILTNLIRVAGWLLMFIGLNLIINPLIVIFKIIPFVSQIAGFISGSIIFFISLTLSLLTISIAWFAYRPLLSISILLIICGIIYLLKDKIQIKKIAEKTEQ